MDWLALVAPLLLFALKVGDYYLDKRRNYVEPITEKMAKFDRVLAAGNVGVINRHIDDLDMLLRQAASYSPR